MSEALPIFRTGLAWALFLDVDGTLLELADHPDAVVVPEGLVPLLGKLRYALGGAFALVSGRSLVSLDALLSEAGLDAAGCHGAELRLGGRAEILAPAGVEFFHVAERLVRLAEVFPMTMVEIKAHSVALHYRPTTLDPSRARELAKAALAGDGEHFRLLEGKQVMEILPVGAGKGKAIAYFMASLPYAGRMPVFVGDDVTDEEGFQEVNRQGGISVRVGADGNTEARFRVATVTEVVNWLAGPIRGGAGIGKQ